MTRYMRALVKLSEPQQDFVRLVLTVDMPAYSALYEGFGGAIGVLKSSRALCCHAKYYTFS